MTSYSSEIFAIRENLESKDVRMNSWISEMFAMMENHESEYGCGSRDYTNVES
jgi:hypothetical protein